MKNKPETIRGECLCRLVRFELDEPVPGIYRCHCSLCRKVSGATSNAAIVINATQFRWTVGKHHVQRWATDSGFSSHFCETCGSPVPNAVASATKMWVPAGLLLDADTQSLSLRVDVFTGSRAPWHDLDETLERHEKMPPASALAKYLKPR